MSRPRTSTEHGQYGYARREKCRCDLCRHAVTTYAKRRFYDGVKGVERRVDAEPARRHVQRLIDAGVSYHQIVLATNSTVSKEQIKNLVEGNSNWHDKKVTWIMPRTADLLLAVTYDQASEAGFTFISAVGVQRRLQALRWMGWTLPKMAEHLPITYTALHHFTKRDRVRTTSVKMIDDLYRKLANTPGGDERERWRAFRAGFLPPAAWDDTDIDDPTAEPDLSAVRCIVEGCPRGCYRVSLCLNHYRKGGQSLERAQSYRRAVTRFATYNIRDTEGILEEVRELRERGFTPQAAAQRLGRPPTSIEKIWSRA